MFRLVDTKFTAVIYASVHSIWIVLQLQHWLRQPLVQPQEVISLRAFGIMAERVAVALADPPIASIAFQLLEEALMLLVCVVLDNCLVVGAHDMESCCMRWRGQSLFCSTNTKQLDSCFAPCINIRNCIYLTDEFSSRCHYVLVRDPIQNRPA